MHARNSTMMRTHARTHARTQALEIAREVAACAPIAVRWTKRMVMQQTDFNPTPAAWLEVRARVVGCGGRKRTTERTAAAAATAAVAAATAAAVAAAAGAAAAAAPDAVPYRHVG
jgi:hypothetical protein